jgi:hypothetical protein
MWFGAQRTGTPAEKASFARRGAENRLKVVAARELIASRTAYSACLR